MTESVTVPIRVTVVQPALAKYRNPVFRELAARRGIQLTVDYAERDGLANVEPDGFAVRRSRLWTPRLAGRMLLVHPAQWLAATRRRTDVLVLNWTPRYITLLPALLRAKLHGVPTVLWGHGYSKTDRPWWRAARHAIARLGTCLLFYDQHTAEGYRAQGWDGKRIFVAPNTIDHSEIDAARSSWESDRLHQFQADHRILDTPVILFVSRLLPQNRVDLLVRATARIAEKIPTVKTVIIGSGDAQRQELSDLAVELGCQEQVLFLPGIYNEKELAPWFRSARVFCYPENIGLSIVHAFWYGLPVVTSNKRTCHNPEIALLDDGRNGLTYEHGSVGSLAAQLERILLDDHLAGQLAITARATVEGHFTIERMVDGLEAAIRFAATRLGDKRLQQQASIANA